MSIRICTGRIVTRIIQLAHIKIHLNPDRIVNRINLYIRDVELAALIQLIIAVNLSMGSIFINVVICSGLWII